MYKIIWRINEHKGEKECVWIMPLIAFMLDTKESNPNADMAFTLLDPKSKELLWG